MNCARRYTGRGGEQVEIREDDAEILMANGYVKHLTGPGEQVA
jgi:hypothetical protein